MRLFPLAVVGALVAPSLGLAAPQPGQQAPAFQGKDYEGRTVDLAQFKGKTVVLEWTNKGCPFVGHMYSSGVMQRLQRDAARDGIVWVTVISSAPGQQGYLDSAGVRAWKAHERAEPAYVVLDPTGSLGHAYDARTTPDMVVIDRNGRVAYDGAIDNKVSTNPSDAQTAHNYVVAALEAVKAGRAPAPALTKSYGCSVKYAD
ncbi:MAG: redoxin family protein [Caulobacteraceae bacterium]|nr:redoxin family protein [Caulobacteraceae bacterium]